jgi:F1F0 ATPase subunit 2
MNEFAAAVLSALAGAGVGVVFFAGLWLTVRRLPSARRPGLLSAASAVARIALAVGVLLAVARTGSWVGVVACLGGFVAARWALVSRVKKQRAAEDGTVDSAEDGTVDSAEDGTVDRADGAGDEQVDRSKA